MTASPIIVIDDDQDDLDLIMDAAKKLQLNQPIVVFKNGNGLIDYLKGSKISPFLILCDLKIPGETGFELKKRIAGDKSIRYKSVPFIFWSTDASEKQIQEAYDLQAQGFFFKPSSLNELCEILQTTVSYWQLSKHPKEIR